MSSDDGGGHLALVRDVFRLYDDGDFDALWDLIDPDFQLEPVFMTGSYRGRGAVRKIITERGDPRGRWSASELEFHTVGDRVVVAGRLHANASLGAPLDLPVAFVFHLRDRMITRLEGHMTLAQAVKSAALVAP
jgi:ketosteroid isomerase-like protein